MPTRSLASNASTAGVGVRLIALSLSMGDGWGVAVWMKQYNILPRSASLWPDPIESVEELACVVIP